MDKILGVKVDNLSRKEILEKIDSFLTFDNFNQIATVNPEFILQAQNDENFRNILNNSSLNVADGFGITCAFLWHGKWLNSRIAGVDLMRSVLELASRKKLKIFLAINPKGLSSLEEIKSALAKLYPSLEIDGVSLDLNLDIKNSRHVAFLYEIRDTRYEILLCNFGAPWQEKFIFHNRHKFGTIKLAMGVGGSFDYITGKVKRAPRFLRWLGLEWLWRLIQQPQRWQRIIKAVLVFPVRVILNK